MKITSDSLPLLKILLHAAKHPSCPVNGILLGSVHKSSNGDGEGEAKVTDIVPMFHASCHLAAPTEVALAQVGEDANVLPGSKPETLARMYLISSHTLEQRTCFTEGGRQAAAESMPVPVPVPQS